jgi:UDP-N-acetylglucosamine 2-epimerase (non-hydrolysing)
MKKFKVLIIVGTRPDAIKMAPLYKEFKNNPKFETLICSSGQHNHLLSQALKIFEIVPDFELNVMTENQNLTGLTTLLLNKFSELFEKVNPDLVLVHGDTTTAFVGALSAFYACIPIGHIEAGLRTHDLNDPFPEEFNRQAISRMSTWNFAPTKNAYNNLISEGINEDKVMLSGNTISDSLNIIKDKLISDSSFENKLITVSRKNFDLNPMARKFILVTLHRRESFGEGVSSVCNALKTISQNNPDLIIVFPVHLNPMVRNDVVRILGSSTNILLVKPIDYDLFVFLMIHCLFIITDSGGIQEEAIFLSKNVLVTRNKTERIEEVRSGLLNVISTDSIEIIKSVNSLLKLAEVSIPLNKSLEIYNKVSRTIVAFFESKVIQY